MTPARHHVTTARLAVRADDGAGNFLHRRAVSTPPPVADMETVPRLDPADRTPSGDVDVSDRRTALVTGSNGGVGLALAHKLAASGWRVLLHGRDPEKLARAHARMDVGAPHEALCADLADLRAVRRLAESVRERTGRLDVLVHNAGLLRPSLERTDAGVEMTMAVNAVAPFALTEALRPLLEATAREHGGARVVTVSSEAHSGGHIPTTDSGRLAEALSGPEGGSYSSLKAYCQSKLVATTWTLELARRLDGTGVTAHACHPGVVRTDVFGGMGGVLGAVAGLFSFRLPLARDGRREPLRARDRAALRRRDGPLGHARISAGPALRHTPVPGARPRDGRRRLGRPRRPWPMPDLATPGAMPAAFAAAWQARDADALADLFEPDAEFVNVVGLWWHDREAIRRAHAYGLEALFPDSALAVVRTRETPLAETVTVVHALFRLTGQSPVAGVARPGERRTLFSFVMRRGVGGWLCASAHNTDVVAGAETHVRDASGTLRPADYRS